MKPRMFLLLSLSILLSTHTTYADQDTNLDWLVIGAGPAGIATLGVLIDVGIDPNSIGWLDPEFNVGRIGAYYHNVPGNSKVAEFIYFVNACRVFQECESPALAALRADNPAPYKNLGTIIEPLKNITDYLRTKVHSVQDMLTALSFRDDMWHVDTNNNHSLCARHVVLATGSRPRTLEYEQQKIIPLDIALDPDNLALLLSPNDIVGIVGGAHSAILLLKFLSDLTVKHIFNFYKVPIIYAINMGTWTLHGDIGIKGTTAEWAKNVLEKNPPANLTRIQSDDELLKRVLPVCSRVIYAIGYERNPLPAINNEEPIVSYDTQNGIIGPRLFGIGIAFPEEKITPINTKQLCIGLDCFMQYAQKQVPAWITDDTILQKRSLLQMKILRKVQNLFSIYVL